MSNDRPKSTHWADINADKIIREKGKKDHYTCASGITPSGTVHIGNFREIISVDLVVRALRDKGENVRFIYSWDDYDVFRKVPKNMPQQELLETYLRKPITLVPDVLGDSESYAAANEKNLEELLPIVGVKPEYIYQASKYRNSDYAEGIKTAGTQGCYKKTAQRKPDFRSSRRLVPRIGFLQQVRLRYDKSNGMGRRIRRVLHL